MGNLLGEPFNRYVNDQIYVRQEVHGKKLNRTSRDIAYLNSRNAWVKLSSAIWLEGNRIDYLKSKNGQNNPWPKNYIRCCPGSQPSLPRSSRSKLSMKSV